MTRVCSELYPMGSRPKQKKPGFYLEKSLKNQIDVLIKNIKYDWDFTIIISGSGEVRVGKSVLALQIAQYWNYKINKKYNLNLTFDENNIVFKGSELIKKGNELGKDKKYSVLMYDEAGSDLQSLKVMKTTTQNVLDYFRECGQYNLLNILVIPDFFELPLPIAVTRSIFLLDVTYYANEKLIFKRGFFKFYSKPNKKMLYLMGKKERNYNAYRMDFKGKFLNFYPIDEEKYREAKRIALKKREEDSIKPEKPLTPFMAKRVEVWSQQRKYLVLLLNQKYNLTPLDIRKEIKSLYNFDFPDGALESIVYVQKPFIEMNKIKEIPLITD